MAKQFGWVHVAICPGKRTAFVMLAFGGLSLFSRQQNLTFFADLQGHGCGDFLVSTSTLAQEPGVEIDRNHSSYRMGVNALS